MENTIKTTSEIFKALGDETRLKILKIINSKGNNLCVGMIVSNLNISQPAVSQHLKILKNAGLVEANRQGFHVHYKINKECLAPFGIKPNSFFTSFGSEFDEILECEHKDDTENCNKINNKKTN